MVQGKPSTGSRLTLWAASPQETVGKDGLRFFPSENDASCRLPREVIETLLTKPTALYDAAIQKASAALAPRVNIPAACAAVLLREPVVLLTHLFLDRLARMNRFVQSRGAQNLAVAAAPSALPDHFGKLRAAAASSQEFNQQLIARVAAVWGIPADASPPRHSAPPPPAKRPTANLNFDAPSLPRRARWKLARLLSHRIGRLPTLGLAYAEWCFLDSGLIGRQLADLHGVLEPAGLPKDSALRQHVLGAAAKAAGAAFNDVLIALGMIDDKTRRLALEAYERFIVESFPPALLEEIPRHFPVALARLKPYSNRPLVFSEMGDLHTAYQLAAATALGMERLCVQHAVHYGFTLAPTFADVEFPLIDRFVTWGWEKMPDHPHYRQVAAKPLPSPWLSERRRRWKALERRDFKHDVLLMTDKLQRFPPSLNTNRQSRLDYLPELTAACTALVRGLAAQGLSTLHKPFDDASLEVVAGMVEGLRRDAGNLYRLHEGLDKGLTATLLESCGIVVWEEPGTGPFECWTGGIPSLLLWTREISVETTAARDDFQVLESIGLVHRRPDTLVREAAAFKKDPAAWIGDAKRQAGLERVCRRYAWWSDRWISEWKAFLKEAPRGVTGPTR